MRHVAEHVLSAATLTGIFQANPTAASFVGILNTSRAYLPQGAVFVDRARPLLVRGFGDHVAKLRYALFMHEVRGMIAIDLHHIRS
ncbi:hypothetical protein DL240_16465 [Lujinxingia litoralis]|uniref:Uncharacterized protein n=1 Tax=Lujinxingia litoralis TaxID=2211119 RepID=A0A328C2H3_9DELT|nr:hypothetical protein DL240_16465 [Lujinxingia litoralis]